MKRRQFLIGGTALLAQDRAPNILFCITDDQSWLHTAATGSKWIRTPAFNRIAQNGVLFRNAFVSTRSCAPSRASALTGQDFYRFGSASMNHTEWQTGLRGYPDILAQRGYKTGSTGKGWAPGNWKSAGRTVPPAGPEFNKIRLKAPASGIADIDYAGNFAQFLEARGSAPFCFWVGFSEPHRVFEQGYGVKSGKKLSEIPVPAFLPDTPEVRSDIADYAAEIEWADQQLVKMLNMLHRSGELDNTIVIITSDNGMAFPRAKGNIYEYGLHVPLAMQWSKRIKPGQVLDDLVSFVDFAPTLLEAAGAPKPTSITGHSLLARVTGKGKPVRQEVICGIERHFPGSRPNGEGYPVRAIRTAQYLYIENLTPNRNPAGDRPGPVWPSDDPTGGFGDTDGGPTKTQLCNDGLHAALFERAFGKRPAVELYDVRTDAANLNNLAGKLQFRKIEANLKARLDKYRKKTQDPRSINRGADLDAVMKRFPSVAAEVSKQQEGR